MTDVTTPSPEAPQTSFRDRMAAALRSFGPWGSAAIIVIFAGAMVFMPIAAALILHWAWLSKTPLRDVGLSQPRSWIGGLLVGLALGIGLKFAMKAVVLPWLGAPPVNTLFQNMAGNPREAAEFAAYALIGAGFAEELFFRGYLFERMTKLWGTGFEATATIVVLVTAFFAVAHWQQGLFGIVNAALVGFALAVIFLACGRKLWVAMVTHASFDLTALAMIYLNLETKVSHLVFS